MEAPLSPDHENRELCGVVKRASGVPPFHYCLLSVGHYGPHLCSVCGWGWRVYPHEQSTCICINRRPGDDPAYECTADYHNVDYG